MASRWCQRRLSKTRRAACRIVSGVSEDLTRLAQLLALLESEIKPMMCAPICFAAP